MAEATSSELDLAVNDLGPLAWVLDELRKSLESATKSLKRFVRDADAARGSDLATIDTAPLRIASQQIHQSVGALEMVGLVGPATVLRAMESAVRIFIQQPERCVEASAVKVERASFALVQFLESAVAGRRLSAVELFPQYKDVLEMVSADRIHPADLWEAQWSWIDLSLTGTAPLAYSPSVREQLDKTVLQIVKTGDVSAARNLRDVCLGLHAAQTERQPKTFWALTAAFFEALSTGRLGADNFVKRTPSRILGQYSNLSKGDTTVSDRLAQDILFFCGQVPGDEQTMPCLAVVQKAYRLNRFKVADYTEGQFGKFDPAVLAQGRKRVASAKESWSSVAGGDLAKFKAATDHFSLVSDSLVKLHPKSEPLAQALTRTVELAVQSGQTPKPELAMEVATSILYLEAAFEDLDPSDPGLEARTKRLAERLEIVRTGGSSPPLESWIEEIYRKVSDKQTIGSVVGELHTTLGELERSLDQYFRDPTEKSPLRPVPGQLSQMRGVLSVLGLDDATQAVIAMRDTVEGLIVTDVDPTQAKAAGTFEKLGNNLGALGFLIDMLSYQPSFAKRLFVYEASSGELKPLMGRVAAVPAEDLATQSFTVDVSVPGAPTSTTQTVSTPSGVVTVAAKAAALVAPPKAPILMATVAAVAVGAVAASAASPRVASAPAPAASADDDGMDDDLRDIFLEEAREVIVTGTSASEALEFEPGNLGEQAILRRAFHTLKGSSRMVGLNEFGEAAWSMEQVFNEWLADQKPISPDLTTLTRQMLSGFSSWVDAIDAGTDAAWKSSPFRASSDAMRVDGVLRPLAIGAASAAASIAPPTAAQAPLDLDVFADAPAAIVSVDSTPAIEAVQTTVATDDSFGSISLDAPDSASMDFTMDASPAPSSVSVSVKPTAAQKIDAPVLPVEAAESNDALFAAFAAAGLGASAVAAPANAFADSVNSFGGARNAAQQLADPLAKSFNATEPAPLLLEPTPTPPASLGLADFDFDFGDHTNTAVPAPMPLAEPRDFSFDVVSPPVKEQVVTASVDEFSDFDLEDFVLEEAHAPAEVVALAVEPELRATESAPVAASDDLSDIDLSDIDLESFVLEDLEPAPPVEFSAPAPSHAALPFGSVLPQAFSEPGFLDLPPPAVLRDVASDLPQGQAPEIAAAVASVAALAAGVAGFSAIEVPTSAPAAAPVVAPTVAPTVAPSPAPAQVLSPVSAAAASGFSAIDEQVKVIGPLRINIPLFNVYLNEADEWSRKLSSDCAEWVIAPQSGASESMVAYAHSLAGSSATVGFLGLSEVARYMESALEKSQRSGDNSDGTRLLFAQASEDVRRLLHQFAAGFLKEPNAEVVALLRSYEPPEAQEFDALDETVLAAMHEPNRYEPAPVEPAFSVPVAFESAPMDAQAREPAAAFMAPAPVQSDFSDSDLLALESFSLVEAPAPAPLLAFDAPAVTVDFVQPSSVAASESAPSGSASSDMAGFGALGLVAAGAAALTAAPAAAAFVGSQAQAPVMAPVAQAVFTPVTPIQAQAPAPVASTPMFAQPAAAVFIPVVAPTILSPGASSAAIKAIDIDDEIDAVDAVDPDLFPIFEEEALELLPQLSAALRQWHARPENKAARGEVLRALHTLKGSARLAGALRVGEMAHRIESDIERFDSHSPPAAAIDPLVHSFDTLQAEFDTLRSKDAQSYLATNAAAEAAAQVAAQVAAVTPAASTDTASAAALGVIGGGVATLAAAPRGVMLSPGMLAPATVVRSAASTHTVRVRSMLLDRLLNQAGEVMITRTRLEAELSHLRVSLKDLTSNLDKMRTQLRDIELQAETQMQSRQALAKESSADFDPLEFDRFTRFQEITRSMAESVNDVATVQRNIMRAVEATEDDLIAQARQTRDLQRDLLKTRMVEFEGISERLYRVVRQAGKDAGKQVKLDIIGGSIELDRGVLDRMTPAFEHLLRNCVAHGIEHAETRTASGKDGSGQIVITLAQEGNDISVDFADDGAGLNVAKIRDKALSQGLIAQGASMTDADAANLIFMPGFSTADQVSELAGRGIGMDVVRSEIQGLGGRIETTTQAGKGTHFKMIMPLTTAVTQVVMVRSGTTSIGIPSNVVEVVRRATQKDLDHAYNTGTYEFAGEQVPFFWSGTLLQSSGRSTEPQSRTMPVVVFRSAAQRVALHVDEVIGNQEVVVKNLGSQLSRLPGLAGMSVLASGAVVLIYNPVALAAVYGAQARSMSADKALPHVLEATAGGAPTVAAAVKARPEIPLVMVVDDSITVRRVTQRLLAREGYRVVLAADGLQALEKLQDETPSVVLSDIEMPRMDGFDLARNIRMDNDLCNLPIIMITSRIAEKHKEHAAELGVNHYLGKPYAEDELLSLVRRYCFEEVAQEPLAA